VRSNAAAHGGTFMPRKRAFRHGFSRLAKHDRNAIQVHYLPARREPADHISYSANALLGRALRAADWAAEREEIADLTDKISSALVGNGAIGGITSALAAQWRKLHKGAYFADPSISFARSELENLLRHLSIGARRDRRVLSAFESHTAAFNRLAAATARTLRTSTRVITDGPLEQRATQDLASDRKIVEETLASTNHLNGL
jgi:hypothetical protein